MGCGKWTVKSGIWKVECKNDMRKMECDKWNVENEMWKMGCGKKCGMACEK